MPVLLRARVLSVDGALARVRVERHPELVHASVADIVAATGVPALELPGRELDVWGLDAGTHLWGWRPRHQEENVPEFG